MKSLLTLVLLVASAICALAAPAWATASSTVTVTVSSPSTGCRIAATASVDGCANAPRTGSFLKNCFTPAGAGWINQVSGTTTDWTAGTWHSYNVAGCAEDGYPIGYSVPLSSLKDPLSGGVSVIPGCSYDPTGGRNGNGVLNCGGAAFTGYDGYTTGAIGGHGCLNLVINMPLTTEPTISNFQIKNDGNCLIAGVGSSLTETGTVNHKLHLISGEIDGQGLVYPLSGFAGINGSNIDAKYIAFLDMPSQVVSYRLDDTTTGFSCFACVVKGHNYRGPLCHSEWYGANGNVGAAFENFTYCMIIETTAQQNIGPAPIATSLQSSVPIGSLLLDHVLVSPSHVGGSRNAANHISLHRRRPGLHYSWRQLLCSRVSPAAQLVPDKTSYSLVAGSLARLSIPEEPARHRRASAGEALPQAKRPLGVSTSTFRAIPSRPRLPALTSM